MIRYFGTRRKIFHVHVRNIREHRDDFVETYPDEGDVDFEGDQGVWVYSLIDSVAGVRQKESLRHWIADGGFMVEALT